MTDERIPPDRIRCLIERLGQVPPDDPGLLDAIVAVLLAFRDIPREHHARVFDLMRAFVEISREQKMFLVRIADEDVHNAGIPADCPPTN